MSDEAATAPPSSAHTRWFEMVAAVSGAIFVAAYIGGRTYLQRYYSSFSVAPSELDLAVQDVAFESLAHGGVLLITSLVSFLWFAQSKEVHSPNTFSTRSARFLTQQGPAIRSYVLFEGRFGFWPYFMFMVSTLAVVEFFKYGLEYAVLQFFLGILIVFSSQSIAITVLTVFRNSWGNLSSVFYMCLSLVILCWIVPSGEGVSDGRSDKIRGTVGRDSIVVTYSQWSPSSMVLPTGSGATLQTTRARLIGQNSQFVIVWTAETRTVRLPLSDIVRLASPDGRDDH